MMLQKVSLAMSEKPCWFQAPLQRHSTLLKAVHLHNREGLQVLPKRITINLLLMVMLNNLQRKMDLGTGGIFLGKCLAAFCLFIFNTKKRIKYL